MWYYGTLSCGHEGRVNIVGKMSDLKGRRKPTVIRQQEKHSKKWLTFLGLVFDSIRDMNLSILLWEIPQA